jgi:uncharacterized protein
MKAIEHATQTNRLAGEQSPYLLQHQHNPVDWYPWGDEAFAKARVEHKVVFLSIGYSTCHWCHVMERESFEDSEIAAFLNEHFVSIKVDREERPDVDRIYMTAVQAMTGQGGWPLSVFLTPERQPFYGGTYFPPEPRQDRPGFLQVLQAIQRLWKTQGNTVVETAGDLTHQLQQLKAPPADPSILLAPNLLSRALERLKAEFDPEHGGFGGPPKFPHPSQQRLLLRLGTRFHDAEAIRQVVFTCEKMAAGGIHDQLGGGFARYAVDARWQVPHFEKMLYDNAQLAQLYLDAYLASGRALFARVASDILDYVLRDMTHPEGGFYSAEDADSEGKEGKFYCWTLDELSDLLEIEELQVACHYYGLSAEGNFVDHSDPNPLPGQNVLCIADPRLAEGEAALLESARAKMFKARLKRVRPHLDDKVLSSWNGLMLGAFARAGIVLSKSKYLKAAELNLAFLKRHLWDETAGKLHHRWRAGVRDQVQLLSAYSFMAQGVLDLYAATLNPDHLAWACQLATVMVDQFYDPDNGGFWQASPNGEKLILHAKEDHDSAEPSGGSVAIMVLLQLAAITGVASWKTKADQTLRLYAGRLNQYPEALTSMLAALDLALHEPDLLVIAGPRESEDVQELLRAAHRTFKPHLIILGTEGLVPSWVRHLPAQNSHVAAYLCQGQSCRLPVFTAKQLAENLGSTGGPPA